MSWRESRDDVAASPARARSLLTVRAAISSAVSSLRPCSRSESLMCSYCRARFDPFSTPRGGICPHLLGRLDHVLSAPVPASVERQTAFTRAPSRARSKPTARQEGGRMYIGIGTLLAIVLIILLLVLVF
jgi:hypothetical protein